MGLWIFERVSERGGHFRSCKLSTQFILSGMWIAFPRVVQCVLMDPYEYWCYVAKMAFVCEHIYVWRRPKNSWVRLCKCVCVCVFVLSMSVDGGVGDLEQERLTTLITIRHEMAARGVTCFFCQSEEVTGMTYGRLHRQIRVLCGYPKFHPICSFPKNVPLFSLTSTI